MLSETTYRELKAAHGVVLYLRREAFHGLASKEVGCVLDDLEYLLQAILEGRTESFRQMLCDMESKYPYVKGIVARFDEGRLRTPLAA
jgi:hypothetical protein